MDKKGTLKKTGYLLGGFLLLLPLLVFAFETKFFEIPGVLEPTDFPSFINYLYYFLLLAGSAVSSLSLAYGGFIYVISGGNPGKTLFAKQQIFASFSGLAILLCSFMALTLLNPDLTMIKQPYIPTASGPGLLPITDPQPHIISYWEIPIGEIEDDVLKKALALVDPVDLAKPVEDLVKKLENEAKVLNEMVKEKCKCSNLISDCDDAACSPLQCTAASGDEAVQADLCKDLDDIIAQQNIVKGKQEELRLAQKPLLFAKINLEISTIKLSVARSLLNECLPSPIDLDTFLGIQDMEGIERKIFFNNTSNRRHPLTFYCQLDDNLVSQSLNFWNAAVTEMLTRLNPNTDPYCGSVGNCPDGIGHCSFENMQNYFVDDYTSHNFSAICQGESSGNPLAMNTGCLTGASLDYSIGLMQINLLAWCSEAITYNSQTNICTILDQAKLDQCVQTYQDADNNLNKAVEIFALQGYGAWGAAYRCGIVDNCEEPPGGTDPPPIVEDGFSMPVNSACMTSPWDVIRTPTYCHDGVDIIGGSSIFASAAGTVSAINKDPSSNPYGNWVTINHNIEGHTFHTFYAHLASFAANIDIGDSISAGQFIGIMGNTGSGSQGVHLHFGIYTNFSDYNGWPSGNDINPQSYLPSSFQCCAGEPYQSWCAQSRCNP